MFYFESDKEAVFLWPAVAISLAEEFWVEIAWLNFGFGWRSGDGGDDDPQPNERKPA